MKLMFLAATLAIATLMSFSGKAISQTTLDPGVEFLKELQRERERDRVKRSTAGKRIEVKEPQKVKTESFCFDVKTIHVAGVTALEPADLQEHIREYSGTCMGQKAIEALLQSITNSYVTAGFITTRAHVPPQDLNSKTLKIVVLEGTIEAFVYQVVDKKGKTKAGKSRKIKGAFPIKAGDILQLRLIEQGLDQINRLASSQASVNLRPGSKPGTSIVVIQETKGDTVRLTLGGDNNGSSATGTGRVRASLEVDDKLGLNETASVSFVGTQNTNALSYNFSVPYKNWTFSSFGFYSDLVSPVSVL